MAALYTRAADRKTLAIEAMDKMAPQEQNQKSYSRSSPERPKKVTGAAKRTRTSTGFPTSTSS